MALTRDEFHDLVDRHGATLYRVAYRMLGDQHEAEDAVQDAFRSAWLSRERYDPQRGGRAWLAAILRRRIVDRWRKPREVTTAAPGEFEIETLGRDPIEDTYSDEMQAALAKLPENLKEALLLVVVGELTHQEVADLVGAPLGTILSRVSRARERMREYLAAAGQPKA